MHGNRTLRLVSTLAVVWFALGFLSAWGDNLQHQSLVDQVKLRMDEARANGAASRPRVIALGGSSAVVSLRAAEVASVLGTDFIQLTTINELRDVRNVLFIGAEAAAKGDVVLFSSLGFLGVFEWWDEPGANYIAQQIGRIPPRAAGSMWVPDWSPFPGTYSLMVAIRSLASPRIVSLDELTHSCHFNAATPYQGRPKLPSQRFFSEIRNTQRALQEKGVQLIVVLPNVLVPSHTKEAWTKHAREIRDAARAHGITVLESSETTFFDDDPSKFCDFAHLKPEAGKVHSTKIGASVRERLSLANTQQ